MDRINTSTKAVDLFGVGKHGFKDGDLAIGIAPTNFNAAWCNGTQEELLAVIEGAGLVPDSGTLNQLQQAILLMIAALRGRQIQPIAASVAANALTVTVQPTSLDFRVTDLTSGAVNLRELAAAVSLVVPSGATLGTVNGVLSRLVVLLLDNAGALEPAIVNLAGGVNLDETGLISTTAIDAAADLANVVYSQAARANLPYRVVGWVESTQAAAGTWATVPSRVQGAGGQAIAAIQSLGYGQTWQNLSGSRAFGTTYYNTTGRPIAVGVTPNSAASGVYSGNLSINGVVVSALSQTVSTGNYAIPLFGVVPPGGSYSVNVTNMAMGGWAELR